MGRLDYASKRVRIAFYTRRGHTFSTHAYLSLGGPCPHADACCAQLREQPMSTTRMQAKTLSSAGHDVAIDLHATWNLIDWACNLALHLIEARKAPHEAHSRTH